jgi:hypothetical protein
VWTQTDPVLLQTIQRDFVEARQAAAAAGHPLRTPEQLAHELTLARCAALVPQVSGRVCSGRLMVVIMRGGGGEARLVAASFGETTLTPTRWTQMRALEAQRVARLAPSPVHR